MAAMVQAAMGAAGAGGIPAAAGLAATPTVTSTVISIGNMVTPNDLADDAGHAELILETEEECKNFGEGSVSSVGHVHEVMYMKSTQVL